METALIIEGPEGHSERDVTVDVDPQTPACDLVAALGRHLGLRTGHVTGRLVRTGSELDLSTPVGSLELRQGDRIVLDGGGRPATRSRGVRDRVGTTFELLIVGGPMSGVRFPLPSGTYVLGRGAGCTIVLDDPSVSRRHVQLAVGASAVEVSDIGSTNGSFLNGKRLEGLHRFESDYVLEIGDTLLAVERIQRQAALKRPYADGRLLFNRQPRIARPLPQEKLSIPVAPERPAKASFPIAASVIPLLLGLVMFVVFKQVMFLLFMALSPIMAVFSLLENRRSGRKGFVAAAAKFEADLETSTTRLEQAHVEMVAARRHALPSIAHVADRARHLSPDLWDRRLDDPDFLCLRIGTADLPTRLEIEGGGGGDEEMRGRSQRLRDGYSTDVDVPVEVALRQAGVLGLAGDADRAEALARCVAIQAAALHSPRDLAIVALVPEHRLEAWRWLQWLPHTETLSSRLGGARSVAVEAEGVGTLFHVLEELVSARRVEADRRLGASGVRLSPHVLLLLLGEVPVSKAAVSRLLADGPSVGVSALCLAATTEELPGECRAIVRAGRRAHDASLTMTATGDEVAGIIADGAGIDLARDVALALAPVRDVTAGSAGSELPSTVPLLELLGPDPLDPDEILSRWTMRGTSLAAPIGIGPTGTVVVDLDRDGPHALVAGTTGGGKSELLQTLVASLASTHPPSRLTFVLIDYKGGAAFKDCVHLPHTVGFFTDLDSHLAGRALQSLNAELRHREEILREAGAKDLPDMERRDPGAAPPKLVIIIDEFAFLKNEVPEFVSGVVDIAQRGRSLGIHLVLATQRPSGVVDDKIRANTSLRIALRVSDELESTDVLGRPDAARIPRSLPGRAYLRTGHAEVQAVQTAYVGGQRRSGPALAEIRVSGFGFGLVAGESGVESGTTFCNGGGKGVTPEGRKPGRTKEIRRTSKPGRGLPDDASDLQRIVAAVRVAQKRSGHPLPGSPWLEPLSSRYPLAPMLKTKVRTGPKGLLAAVGMVDDPARQCQQPWSVDLAADGHLLVYGTSGSGKTTLLRTLAASLATQSSPKELHLYGLDFAGRGLLGLEKLPHCGGVVTSDEIERAERLFAMLEALTEQRKTLLGRAGVSSLLEYRQRRNAGPQLPYVVVLLDGYTGFASAFGEVDHGQLIDRLAGQVADGRGVGIHFVIGADRRSGIPSSLTGIISSRIVLRMADEDEYSWLGVREAAKGATLPAGRGFVKGGLEFHAAVVGNEAAGDAQTGALVDLGRRLATRFGPASVPRIELLPNHVDRTSLPVAERGRTAVPMGLEGTGLGPALCDLDDVPAFLVVGPDRTGRTTALRTIAAGLRSSEITQQAFLFAPRRSALTGDPGWTETARGLEACEELAARLAEEMKARAQQVDPDPVLVVIDDGDELTEGKVALSLETLVRRGRDARVLILVAAQTHVVHRTFGGWITDVRKANHGLVLAPDAEVDGEIFGVRLPRKTVRSFPPGRGYLVRRGLVHLVQVAE